MFGINGSEALILVVVALLVVGPERLPRYAERLGLLARQVRDVARHAKARVDDELGGQLGEVDWQSLDPRQYDPRRIVRDALVQDLATTPAPRTRPGSVTATESTRDEGLAPDTSVPGPA